ncbi:MarR family winged helix-turn-helix transcriptional regulator [Microbacterium sp.]|uniref:MarR family winged helix-turn-helix transcriptional regulator n=1 Tax=Microbacterium sp. TaxID=51671 RepID=UPI003C7582A2
MTWDAVDEASRQWEAAWPGLDTSPGEVLARIQRLAHVIDERQGVRLRRAFELPVSNLGDFDVIRALRRAEPPHTLTHGQLKQAMLVSAAGLTGRLKRLEDDGWIIREQSPSDARSVLIRLSEKGRAALDAGIEAHFDFENSMLASLTPSQREQLVIALRNLIVTLE